MSSNQACKNCGAPLSPQMAKCTYCKTANPAFVAPVTKTVSRTVYTAAAPSPKRSFFSPQVYYGQSLFDYSGPIGKGILILLGLHAIACVVIMAVPSIISNFYYSAEMMGLGSDLIRIIIITGWLSAFWSLNSFIPADSAKRMLSLIFLFLMLIVYIALFSMNVSHDLLQM